MGDLTSSDSISSVMEIANNVVESNPTEGFLEIIKKKFSENKMYVYIGIAVIVLAVVLYYFYIKNKKETESKTESKSESKPVLELPKPKQLNQVQPNEQNNQNNQYAQAPQISGDEYWVMDAQGRPVKVSGSFGGQIPPLPMPKQAPSAAEIKMLQQQMLEQQMMQQQMMQQQMMQQQMEQQQKQLAEQKAKQAKKPQAQPKLKHPEDSDNSESDDIDVELARIKANEDENVAQHDLTNSELAEITKKLEIMGNQLNNN